MAFSDSWSNDRALELLGAIAATLGKDLRAIKPNSLLSDVEQLLGKAQTLNDDLTKANRVIEALTKVGLDYAKERNDLQKQIDTLLAARAELAVELRKSKETAQLQVIANETGPLDELASLFAQSALQAGPVYAMLPADFAKNVFELAEAFIAESVRRRKAAAAKVEPISLSELTEALQNPRASYTPREALSPAPTTKIPDDKPE